MNSRGIDKQVSNVSSSDRYTSSHNWASLFWERKKFSSFDCRRAILITPDCATLYVWNKKPAKRRRRIKGTMRRRDGQRQDEKLRKRIALRSWKIYMKCTQTRRQHAHIYDSSPDTLSVVSRVPTLLSSATLFLYMYICFSLLFLPPRDL